MDNNLKVYRAKYDLTQKQLAKEIGVSRQTIISIEKKRYEPSLSLAFKISNYFEVKIEDVFKYNED